jgi:hypothetical protein
MLDKTDFSQTEQFIIQIPCMYTVYCNRESKFWTVPTGEGKTESIHTDSDVTPAEELAVNVVLPEGGPAGVLLEFLVEGLIGEHVEQAQDLHHRVGEAILQEADLTHWALLRQDIGADHVEIVAALSKNTEYTFPKKTEKTEHVLLCIFCGTSAEEDTDDSEYKGCVFKGQLLMTVQNVINRFNKRVPPF